MIVDNLTFTDRYYENNYPEINAFAKRFRNGNDGNDQTMNQSLNLYLVSDKKQNSKIYNKIQSKSPETIN